MNSDGVFNVPYGAPKTDKLIDAANFRECASLLAESDVQLHHADFSTTVAKAGEGDLVFMDPPYVTRHNNNGFIDADEVEAIQKAFENDPDLKRFDTNGDGKLDETEVSAINPAPKKKKK